MRIGGERQDVRASALWGSGKRRTALLATLALALTLPFGVSAAPASAKEREAYVTPTLLAAAQARSGDTFAVIVQGKRGNQAAHAVADVLGESKKVVHKLRSTEGVAVELTGTQILALAAHKHVTAVTADARIRLSANTNNQKWPYVTGLMMYWSNGTSPAAPTATIAIVDSGIEAARPEFGGRVVAGVNLSSLPGNSAGDRRGHGTFVAGIAAGDLSGHTGAAPSAKIVSLDVMDDQGMARTSDVIAAADWILANKANYGIRVANFSLHSSVANSFSTTRSTRRSRSSGSTTSRSLPPPETTAPRAVRAACLSRRATTRSSSPSARATRVIPLDERRRRGALVGLRIHARRIREAGPCGARPLHDRARADDVDALCGESGPHRRAGIPRAFWNLVRGTGRQWGRCAHPRPPSRIHIGPALMAGAKPMPSAALDP